MGMLNSNQTSHRVSGFFNDQCILVLVHEPVCLVMGNRHLVTQTI